MWEKQQDAKCLVKSRRKGHDHVKILRRGDRAIPQGDAVFQQLITHPITHVHTYCHDF